MKAYQAVLAGMLLSSGCATVPDEAALDTEPPTAVCTNLEAGYQVSYPSGWAIGASPGVPACSLFNPTPVYVSRDGEVPLDVAVALVRHPIPYEHVERGLSGEQLLWRELLHIDGRPAVRVESLEPGDGETSGLRAYRYAVDLGHFTLVGATFAIGLLDYELKKAILDRMMETLSFEGGSGSPEPATTDRRRTRG